MKITDRQIRMITPEGFDKIFIEESSKYRSYKETFQKLNAEYMEVFGEPRYQNYDSYKSTRWERITKK